MFRDAKAAETFAKFIRLLGSDRDGERAVAALKATHLLRANGLDWHAVAAQVAGRPATQVRAPAKSPPRPHQSFASECLNSGLAWKPHERDFLSQIAEQLRVPTEKQQAWLDGLVDRARRHVAAKAAP